MPEFHVLRISESGDLLGSNGCFRGLGRGYLEYESRVAGGSYTRPDRKNRTGAESDYPGAFVRDAGKDGRDLCCGREIWDPRVGGCRRGVGIGI